MQEKYIVLIPAYEPDDKLIHLVKELSKEDLDIIIVDDGSGKDYKEIFNSCEKYSKIISYEINQGKGHALKTGFKYIKENYKKPYIIATMDCDGQHTIKDAKKLMKACSKDKDIYYLGKRIRSDKTPIRSRIGNSITKFIYKKVAGLDIYDTQTGLRAFSDNLIDNILEVPGSRFEYEMNVLLEFARSKIKMKEIQIETIYIENNSGTHFKAIKDSYKIYKDIIKHAMSKKEEK